jgi:release factor glutamine methyltransferase
MTMANLPTALRDAAKKLTAISETPRLDAELLMSHALGVSRSDMLLRLQDLQVPDSFLAMINRRIANEPVAYIIGKQAFWDLELRVTPDVLIPRADSETVLEAADAAFSGRMDGTPNAPQHILDLGTGSGALLLAALSLFGAAQGVGIDASAAALAVAQYNVKALGFSARAEMRLLSWRDAGWEQLVVGPYNLILCNPPYVETGAVLAPMVAHYEPHDALFAGHDGMDDYRIVIPALPALLSEHGVAIIEIGHSQAKMVMNLASSAGLSATIRQDLAGNPRVLTLRAQA